MKPLNCGQIAGLSKTGKLSNVRTYVSEKFGFIDLLKKHFTREQALIRRNVAHLVQNTLNVNISCGGYASHTP